jgi:hypothetical protein
VLIPGVVLSKGEHNKFDGTKLDEADCKNDTKTSCVCCSIHMKQQKNITGDGQHATMLRMRI